MADFFDTLKHITFAAAKKADKTCRAARLKLSKATLERILVRQYVEMGKIVYDMCKSDKDDVREIVYMTAQIDGTRKRIAALDRRIENVLELVKCPRCGTVIKMKHAYCSSCGKKLITEDEDVLENENEMNIPD